MALYELSGDAALHGGVLVVALDGWVDAGLGASTAITHLLGSVETELVARFDGEALIDQRARRPMLEIVDGRNTGLSWPEIQLRAGRDRAGNPVGFLVGPEPDFRWRSFGGAAAELAAQLGVRLAVGLGAFPAPAPHTRPVRVAATSPDADLAGRIGVVPGVLQVPAGIEALLELALEEVGIPAVGLWARVPHYVSAMPYPAASAVLVDSLGAVGELDLDSSPLHAAADVARQRVDELISQSTEHQAMVAQLESNLDAAEGNPLNLGEVPSGEEIAAELERYLRGE
ncbi:MAG: proteasome assembly chaperone family protein [Acidimicrobiales bacterium]